ILSGSTTGFGSGGGGDGGGGGFGSSALVCFGCGDGSRRPSKKSGRVSDCENVESAGCAGSAIPRDARLGTDAVVVASSAIGVCQRWRPQTATHTIVATIPINISIWVSRRIIELSQPLVLA